MARSHGRNRRARSMRRRIALIAVSIMLACVALVGGAVGYVQLSQRDAIVAAAAVTPAPVAIVPGAAVWPGPRPSTYLERRLQGALDLYDAGFVTAILVSGAAPDPQHDEPAVMRQWLVDHGVPAGRIVSDSAGFDTHDTCVRAHDVFGVTDAVVVTQDYHLPRALFLCDHAGIDVQGVAVSAADGTVGKYRVREMGASLKAAYDVLTSRPPGRQDPPSDALTKALNSQ